jgi:hypothetical protein
MLAIAMAEGASGVRVQLLLLPMRMRANSGLPMGRSRHFDRGQRLLLGLSTALILVACSRGLPDANDPGTGGSPGTGQGGGAAGGIGGAGGATRPTCPTGTAMFSVCVVNNTDVLPFPSGAGGGPEHDSVTAAPATVEAVGTGAAPAQCQSARVFGAAVSSDRWFQIRTADSKLWTIGVGGLGSAPIVKTGDSVTLDLTYQFTPSSGPMSPAISGSVQLSNSAGTPLLWAGDNTYSAPWLSLNSGQALCDQTTGPFGCPTTRYQVTATVNGSVATLEPFSATNLGGYYLAVGEYTVVSQIVHTQCAFDPPPVFAAAAVKLQ